jgi:acetylornithine deacetylase
VIAGEPTNMEAVRGHKGISVYTVTVTGREAHSSLTHLGVSAVMAAVKLMALLADLSERLELEADPVSPFQPKGASLTIGLVEGGTATNILARECRFTFDLRCPPGLDPESVLQGFYAAARALDVELKTRSPDAGVRIDRRSATPGLAPEADGDAEILARLLAGDNGPGRVVSYAAEAGQFQEAGFSTVICGPGSIDQAHQPDEYIEVTQMQRGAQFMARLIESLAR